MNVHARNKVVLLSAFLSYVLLVSSAQDVGYSILNGNWHLTGGPELSQYPALDITLGVDGTTIYGEGHLQVECMKYMAGLDVFVVGTIAPDGTFVLTNNPPYSSNEVTIRGSVPSPESREWQGSFRTQIKGHDFDNCSPAQGDIVAKPFPPLKGVFSGVLDVSDHSKTEISLEIAQGQLISSSSRSPHFSHCVPLNVRMTISDSSSFPAGVFTTDGNTLPQNCNDRMSGNHFEQRFTLTDGSTLSLHGAYRYADLDRLDITLSTNLRQLPKDPTDPKEQPSFLHAAGRLTRR